MPGPPNRVTTPNTTPKAGSLVARPLRPPWCCGAKLAQKKSTTAIQIRYGGAKGVLSLNPTKPSGLYIRPSQIKFDAEHHLYLEVCCTANAIPYYLNRQIILLLSNARVPESVFLTKQAEMISQLNQMLYDPVVAVQVLPRLGGVACLRLLLDMLEAGASPVEEPFLGACLRAIRRQALALLRTKSRLLVPPDLGVTLLGSPDDVGVLGPEQVFLQVVKDSRWQAITGPVLVTKHPVTHPGDVRLLTAVDHPALRHHKNEVVFSVQGDRPLPNQMSGSDLDGDLYAVTWDRSLFPPRGNYTPQDYAAAKPIDKPEGVSVPGDLIDHMINHAKNDNLGKICRWLEAHADQALGEGRDIAHIAECLELARLASVAVDFPKSGVPAEVRRDLNPRRHPHWMESKGKESYHSYTVVGKMYDEVVKEQMEAVRDDREFRTMVNDALLHSDSTWRYEWPPALDPALCVEHSSPWCNWQEWRDWAGDMQDSYEEQIWGLMRRYGLKDEAELLTGCVVKFKKLARRREHDAKQAVQEEVDAITRALRSHLFGRVYQRLHPHVSKSELQGMRTWELMDAVGVNAPQLRAAASALLWATHVSAVQEVGEGPVCALHGMPWVVAGDVLSGLRTVIS